MSSAPTEPVDLLTIAKSWGRIGCVGFGGPPAHIALLRALCVADRGWLSAEEFSDAVAATNLLPGPASTQMAIWCAWRLRGRLGAVIGGTCFIAPGLIVILALAALFLEARPPLWVLGAASGAGAAVPAVAGRAARDLLPAAWSRVGRATAARWRWALYLVGGAVAGATAGAWVVIVLVGCGLIELAAQGRDRPHRGRAAVLGAHVGGGAATAGGLGAVAWVAFKVGALSYGGGFVIIPLMQHDAVGHYHWMTGTQFLSAVALGQVTPGPVVQTVAVVGYAAGALGGGLLAAAVAFVPSFVFVLVGGRHFDRLRRSPVAQSFLSGAGPAAIGAIAGAAIPLARALQHAWQAGVVVAAAIWLLGFRRSVAAGLVAAGVAGVAAAFLGAPVGR
jgi:chromate transporter